MRREHRDGCGEVLGGLVDFAGQEAELPALHRFQRRGELAGGLQEFLPAGTMAPASQPPAIYISDEYKNAMVLA